MIKHKLITTALCFTIATIFFTGCCKEYCIKEPKLSILFSGYKAINTDTVYIIQYNKGTLQASDSVALINSTSDTASYSGLSKSIAPEWDWKIVLPSVNRQFFFTNFQTETEKCTCEGGNYSIVSQYQLDGQPKQGSVLILP